MQNFFLDYIREKELLREGDQVLLAVSGGLDSVVLAHLFSQSPFGFAIAHVNFELRAAESEEDALFVENLARQLQVSFFSTRRNAASFAEAHKVSIQMAARTLRYQWFEETRRSAGYQYTATAHHLNDLAETMLLNLSRGTGIAGLHGIAPRRGRLIRPLLFTSRPELEAYAHAQGLHWREDSSNSSLKYRRNKIRQQVVPVLKTLNPRLEWSMQETALKLGAAENIIKNVANDLRKSAISQKGGYFYLQLGLLLQTVEPRYLLAELLAPFGGGWQEAGAILESLHKSQITSSGKEFITPSHRISIDRQQLLISRLENETFPPTLLHEQSGRMRIGPYLLQTQCYPAENYQLNKDPAVVALDKHKLSFPLLLRRPQPGDWFRPLGMQGKKKLSDFMIDRKIPVKLKDEVLLVTSGQAIAWVAGYRPDERFKIEPHTKEVFEIKLL